MPGTSERFENCTSDQDRRSPGNVILTGLVSTVCIIRTKLAKFSQKPRLEVGKFEQENSSRMNEGAVHTPVDLSYNVCRASEDQ